MRLIYAIFVGLSMCFAVAGCQPGCNTDACVCTICQCGPACQCQ